MDPLLTTAEAAEILHVSPVTVAQWRWLGKGPVYQKIGHSVRYYQSDLEAYIEASRVVPSR